MSFGGLLSTIRCAVSKDHLPFELIVLPPFYGKNFYGPFWLPILTAAAEHYQSAVATMRVPLNHRNRLVDHWNEKLKAPTWTRFSFYYANHTALQICCPADAIKSPVKPNKCIVSAQVSRTYHSLSESHWQRSQISYLTNLDNPKCSLRWLGFTHRCAMHHTTSGVLHL